MDARADSYYSYQGRVDVTESYYNEKPTMKLISPILRTVWTERLLGQMRSLFRKGLCTYA